VSAPSNDTSSQDDRTRPEEDSVALQLGNDWGAVRRCLQREFRRINGVYELALVRKGRGVVTGYADNPDTAERLIREAYDPQEYQGAYIGINPLHAPPPGRELSAAMVQHSKRADSDLIPKRTRLFFDIDSDRSEGFDGGAMATEAERANAMVLSSAIEEFLMGLGWPSPAQRGDSGNGAFLVYLINEPNNDDTSRLIEAVLKGVARATSDIPGAHVDTSVYDAPRIMKIPGTLVAKQSSPGRPWRRAEEDELPASPVVSKDLLELAALYDRHEPAPETLDNLVTGIHQNLAARNIRITRDHAKNGGRMLDLSACLLTNVPHNNDGSCAIHVRSTGVTIFCLAEKCRDKTVRGSAAFAMLGLNEPELIPAGADDPRPWLPAGMLDLQQLMPKVWSAVGQLNKREPTLLRTETQLVRVREPEDTTRRMAVAAVNEKNDLLLPLAAAAQWYTIDKPRAGQVPGPRIRKPAKPPEHAMLGVLKDQDPPVPPLDHTVEHPIILPGGKLLAESGYYPEHGVAMTIPPELQGLDVSERPTQEQAAEALAFLRELLVDFPFETGWDEGNALGLMLTPFLRPAIDSFVPPFTILGNGRGIGKTNLGSALLRPALGDQEFYIVHDSDEAERRKTLASWFRSGHWAFGWDNLEGRFKSSILASLVTTRQTQFRVVGSPELAVSPVGAVVVIVGNNVQFDMDMRDRLARIRMYVPMARPSDRKLENFVHPNVWDEILDRRREVVEALLTIALHWWTAGSPRPDWLAPRHTSWSRHVHGALQAAGWSASTADGRGYADGHNEIHLEDDAEGAAETEFVAQWWERYQSKRMAGRDVLDLAAKAGISFKNHSTDLSGRAAELSQEILPAMAKFVFELDTEDGILEVQIRKMPAKRGARATWAIKPVDANDPKSATPTTPSTGWGSPPTEKQADKSVGEKNAHGGIQLPVDGAAGAASSDTGSFTDMTGGAM
jgi:hypothetical protein